MATASAILYSLRSQLDITDYKKLHWEGTFADYLNIVLERPGSPGPRTSGCTT